MTVDNRRPPNIQHRTKRFPILITSYPWPVAETQATYCVYTATKADRSPYYCQQLQHRNTSRLPPQAYDIPLMPLAIMANFMKS